MKTKKQVVMEDINSWTLHLMHEIMNKVELNSIEEDRVWNEIQAVLEKSFDYPYYKNYN